LKALGLSKGTFHYRCKSSEHCRAKDEVLKERIVSVSSREAGGCGRRIGRPSEGPFLRRFGSLLVEIRDGEWRVVDFGSEDVGGGRADRGTEQLDYYTIAIVKTFSALAYRTGPTR